MFATMKFKVKLIFLLFAISLTCSVVSCKKKNLFGDGNLEFSTSELVFDTVFTTIGSTTKNFKIYNKKNNALKIEEVQLMGGSNSPFKINLDGLKGTYFTDIELAKKDSLFCFVEVKLNVNGQNLPLIVEDSIRLRTNGEDQYVKLVVWGQDMYYHNKEIMNTQTWPTDKPHVIYGYAAIDSAQTLNIVGGTRIYMHKGAILWNYKGTLNMDGEYNNKIILQGDRLESFYSNVPGQYYGIYFQEARPSMVDNVVIKNATAGIHIDSRDQNYSLNTVTLSNTEIYNTASYGLFLYNEPKVYGQNLLVHSSGVHALLVIRGAEFTFNHCNFLGYGTAEGTSTAVGISNKYTTSNGTYVGSIPTGDFNNCVIYGSSAEQIAFDTLNTNGITLNFHIRNSVIRSSSLSSPIYTSCSSNDPIFSDPGAKNFEFSSSTSSLNNNGNQLYSTGTDLLNTFRNNPPDIGVYENE